MIRKLAIVTLVTVPVFTPIQTTQAQSPDWTTVDVTAKIGGFQPKSTTSKVAAFAGPGLSQILIVVGKNNDIHEITNNATNVDTREAQNWVDRDITRLSGINQFVTPVDDPAGFWGSRTSIHVYFVGSDAHIYEIIGETNDGPWHSSDITVASGAHVTAAKVNAPLGAFMWIGQNTEHVSYLGSDSHIHEMVNKSGQWNDADIRALTPTAPEAVEHPIGFIWEGQKSEHIFYMAKQTQHLIELANGGNSWSASDIMTRSGTPSLKITNPDIAAYMWEQENTEHIMFSAGLGADLYEAYFDNQWFIHSLYHAPTSDGSVTTSPSAYVYLHENTQHVVFGIPSGLWELYYSGGNGWSSHALTYLLVQNDYPDGRLTGFAWQTPDGSSIFNFQAIVFVGAGDNHLYELSYMK